MPAENTYSVDSKLIELETSLLQLERELNKQRIALDTMTMDVRALNTSLQNILLSFGALKEKSDTIFSTVVTLTSDRDSKLDKISEEHKERIQVFRDLCDSKNSAIEIRSEAAIKAVQSEITMLKEKMAQADTEQTKRLDSIEGKINWAVGSAITMAGAVILYIIKIVLLKLGVPVP